MSRELGPTPSLAERFVQPGYTALLATGLMLPVSGVISGWLAFTLAGFPASARLAATAPLGDLATAGVYPIQLVLLSLAYAWVIGKVFRRIPEPATHWLRTTVIGALPVFVLAPIIGAVTGPALGLVGAATAAVAYLTARLELRRPVRGRALVVVLVVLYVLAALATGLATTGGPAIRVDASGAPAGWSLRLAEDADWLYLAPCAEHGAVVQIPKGAIRTVTWATPVPQGGDLVSEAAALRTRTFYSACP